MNDPKPRRAALFIAIALTALFLILALGAWFGGQELGWSQSTRIIIELGLLSGWLLCLIFVKFFEAVLLWIASMWASRWLMQYDAQANVPKSDQAADSSGSFSLANALRDRHGWRWRYRDRWVLIAGDESLVKRLAPELMETGYAITNDVVLLYAKQTTDTLDTRWLEEVRRLRPRCPVDAIVAVTCNRGSATAPLDSQNLVQGLARHARALRWAAPAYVLNVTDFESESIESDEAIGFTWTNARTQPAEIDASLRDLVGNLANAGVVRLAQNPRDRYAAELSHHIDGLRSELAGLVTGTHQSRFWRNSVHGLLFAPLFQERDLVAAPPHPEAGNAKPNPAPQQHPVWNTIANHSRSIHGRRVGFSLATTAAWITTSLAGLWIAGTMLSGFTNRSTIADAANTASKLAITQDPTQTALTLDALQKQLDTLEVHQHDGAPWYTRFGLNRDTALFNALWPAYEYAAARTVGAPIRARLEDRLRQLASLSDADIASGGEAQIKAAYDTLKTYLMLVHPERANPVFLIPELIATGAPARPANSALSDGAWQDLRAHLAAFYANHLGRRVNGAGSSLAITPDASLVNAARQTVIGVRGIQNSTDAVYQQILDDAKPKYPPASLSTLLGDTSSQGLFNTTMTVPGVFTRTAWDERISKAIDDASEHDSVARDWVVSDTDASTPATASLKAELRQRYFDDYARAWQAFLNSVHWQPTPTLSGTIDQLTLLGDPQRSPLVALMSVVVYQAGAGATTQSFSDTLLNKAQQLVGAGESSKGTAFGAKNPASIVQPQNVAPLATAFAPLLRLTGSDLDTGGTGNSKASAQMSATGDLGLARFLERVTAMRLKLQQIMMSNDPDAMSRAAAQAVLQGKTSDIADSRDYANRVAASLGQQWAGLGDLFQQPLDQTWQVILQPAAASLNDTWRAGILADWNHSLGGRYPFADSDNDASLPEMARFMRPDSGVVTQFVVTQLAGVVERQGDRWVPAQGSGRNALTIDPAFLTALNTLMRVSISLFPSGDARVRFELRAVSTPGVTDMKFVLPGQALHYFNQKEEWTPFIWPGDTLENIARIEWQTEEGGLRSALEMQGRFGLIRLLERATVTPQDNARYLLAWTPDQSKGIPLKVQLRSEAGAGPLDVLTLRHFSLPQRIFLTGSSQGTPKQAFSGPPPLPAAMLESAKYAEVPLPPGLPRITASTDTITAAPARSASQHVETVSAAKRVPPAAPKHEPQMAANVQQAEATPDDEDGVPLSQALQRRTPSPARKPGSVSRLAGEASHASGMAADAYVY